MILENFIFDEYYLCYLWTLFFSSFPIFFVALYFLIKIFFELWKLIGMRIVGPTPLTLGMHGSRVQLQPNQRTTHRLNFVLYRAFFLLFRFVANIICMFTSTPNTCCMIVISFFCLLSCSYWDTIVPTSDENSYLTYEQT